MEVKPYQHTANEAESLQRKYLIERMDEMGITRYRLSKMTGISESILSRYFNEQNNLTHNLFLQIIGALELRPYLVPAEMDKNDMKRMFFN